MPFVREKIRQAACLYKLLLILERLRCSIKSFLKFFLRIKVYDKRMTKLINIALQGGGAHGAFAWGVLDKFLEDKRIEIEAISATSAGAMNGIMCSYGLHKGGRKEARKTLYQFWKSVSELGKMYSTVHLLPWEHLQSGWKVKKSIGYLLFDGLTSVLSPYEFNPLNLNPLRNLLEELIDFEELRNSDAVKLFLSATNVRTGRIRVFPMSELTIDVVLASACLPYLFQSVQIGSEFYWDGGYMGNPAIFPFFHHTKSQDVLIVHTNPIERKEIPKTACDIHNRVVEITFNSSLSREICTTAFVQKLLQEGWLKEEYRGYFKDVFMHSVRSDEEMCELSTASKFNTDWDFLMYLFTKGRSAAEVWLQENYKHLGKRSTADLYQEFLESDDYFY